MTQNERRGFYPCPRSRPWLGLASRRHRQGWSGARQGGDSMWIHIVRARTVLKRAAGRRALALLVASLAALVCAAPAGALSPQQSHMLSLAESGVSRVAMQFGDSRQGLWNGQRNVPISWYDERYGPRPRYPLATIWGSVPLFETLSAIATADPSAANRKALQAFAEGPAPQTAGPVGLAASTHKTHHRTHRHSHRGQPVLMGAESYWDAAVGGYAPYPGDRGKPNVWCDDNAWWGLSFEDAY